MSKRGKRGADFSANFSRAQLELSRAAKKRFSGPKPATMATQAFVRTGGGNELKSLDIGGATNETVKISIFNKTGQVVPLNVPIQGNRNQDRQGNKIKGVSLQVKSVVCVVNGAAASTQGDAETAVTMRMMIVHDKSPQGGSVPAISDILKDIRVDIASVQGVASTVYSGMDMTTTKRFRVLRDKKIVVHQTIASIAGCSDALKDSMESKDWNEFIKLKGAETHFKVNPGTGVIGDIEAGALYLVTLSDEGNTISLGAVASTTTNPNLSYCLKYSARYKFTE